MPRRGHVSTRVVTTSGITTAGVAVESARPFKTGLQSLCGLHVTDTEGHCDLVERVTASVMGTIKYIGDGSGGREYGDLKRRWMERLRKA